MEVLGAAEVPCGPIYTIDKVFDDPQVKHIGAAVGVKSAKLGEHTGEILAELGLEAAAIEALRQKKVV